jgi:GNAT superfamily N-acetyltransferase
MATAITGMAAAAAPALHFAPLTKQHLGEASHLLADAFHHDPFVSMMFPNEWIRSKAMPLAQRAALLQSIAAGGAIGAFEGERLVGAAVTFPYGKYPLDAKTFARGVPSYLGAGLLNAHHLPRMIGEDRLATKYKPTAPHLYVELVGVKPGEQGKGIGSKLLGHVLDAADAAGHPAFLETSNPKNVKLYERLGFDVTSSYTSRGVTNWQFWREPKAAGAAAAPAAAVPA